MVKVAGGGLWNIPPKPENYKAQYLRPYCKIYIHSWGSAAID